MSQASATSSADFNGTVTFGPRDGGNSWVVAAIVGGVIVLALLIFHRGGK